MSAGKQRLGSRKMSNVSSHVGRVSDASFSDFNDNDSFSSYREKQTPFLEPHEYLDSEIMNKDYSVKDLERILVIQKAN